MYLPIAVGATMYFAQPDALKVYWFCEAQI